MSFWDRLDKAALSGDAGRNLTDTEELEAKNINIRTTDNKQEAQEDNPSVGIISDVEDDFELFDNSDADDSPGVSTPSSPVAPTSLREAKRKDEHKHKAEKEKKKQKRDGCINYIDNSPLDDYDDGENPNTQENKLNKNKKKRSHSRINTQHAAVSSSSSSSSSYLDDIEAAMEVGELNEEEDEYESIPIIDLNWTRAINREVLYEKNLIKENKPNQMRLNPEPYDPDFNFLSFAVETGSQETSFPLFRKMFTFFSKTEETSDYVDLCMQVQDYYNEHIRPVSNVGNKCWPVKKIWEYFHVICPSIKHNLEYELRSLNVLYDMISNCVLKRNKTSGKVDQMDIKCLKTKFQIMEYRNKLMREVFTMRAGANTEESKSQN